MLFLRIQRKPKKEAASKGLRSNGATGCLQNFGKYLGDCTFLGIQKVFFGIQQTQGLFSFLGYRRFFLDTKFFFCDTKGFFWGDTIGVF